MTASTAMQSSLLCQHLPASVSTPPNNLLLPRPSHTHHHEPVLVHRPVLVLACCDALNQLRLDSYQRSPPSHTTQACYSAPHVAALQHYLPAVFYAYDYAHNHTPSLTCECGHWHQPGLLCPGPCTACVIRRCACRVYGPGFAVEHHEQALAGPDDEAGVFRACGVVGGRG